MAVCIDCGGRVKLITKAGRMAWHDNELYEIPQEIKIPTCLECGQPSEDVFVKAKIDRALEGQKKQKPSVRLLQLRYLDKYLTQIFKTPGMFGDHKTVYALIIATLEFREIVISKGQVNHHRGMTDKLHTFLLKRWPDLGCCAYPGESDLDTEFVPDMREFTDLWINT